MGPHYLTHRNQGNAYTREPEERYVSPAIPLNGQVPIAISWDAEVPADAAIKFQVRWASTESGLEGAAWHGSNGVGTYFEQPGMTIANVPDGAGWLQYRAVLVSLYGCSSPRLSEVRIDLK